MSSQSERFGYEFVTYPPQMLADISKAAAEAIRQPGAFTDNGLAFYSENVPASVWDISARSRDVLGWLVLSSMKHLQGKVRAEDKCFQAAEQIGEVIVLITGRSMIDINDTDGCEAVAKTLLAAARWMEREEQSIARDQKWKKRGKWL